MTALFLQNEFMSALVWVGVVICCCFLGFAWMTYLIKIVMNDDEVQEKIRRHKRITEELMRAQEMAGR